ncbi:hypothetical protein THRCLA_22545 [Thraustotheca clavata]|uniref:HTH La-type RNA-binding domain-containing protein n=1 Tax=Thraustotheca clavata TaxID=74557 RepID=A0A1V9YXJ6_9STRA|nr:hypothetical protein THRCLA_22545 [Thraustotheca clavata]
MKLILIACVLLCGVLAKESTTEYQDSKAQQVLKRAIDVSFGREENSAETGYVLSPEQISAIQNILGPQMTQEVQETRPFEGTATQNKAFPGDFRGLKAIDDLMKTQIESLIKVAGVEMPLDLETKVNPDQIQSIVTWYNMAWLAFNLTMAYLFGDGIMGGISVALIFLTFFILLPMALKKRRERAMKQWLTSFYLEHSPDCLLRVPKAIEAYMELSNGFERLKEDSNNVKYRLVEAEEVDQAVIVPSNSPSKKVVADGKPAQTRRSNGGRGKGGRGGRGNGFYYNGVFIPSNDVNATADYAKQQIEFYLSPDNLVRDTFLRQHMDIDGYVPLAFIGSFQAVFSVHQDYPTLFAAMKKSTVVDLDEKNEKVRPLVWKQWLWPQPDGTFGVPRYVKVDDEAAPQH